jgi:hypothetical protein
MSRLCKNPVALSVLLGLVGPVLASGTDSAESDATLTVIVFNYADVPSDTLAEAQRFAEELFQQAGLGIEWAEPLNSGTQHGQKEPIGRPRFVLRIVPNSMIGAWAGGHALLGFSLVPATEEMGSIAGVYQERVAELSRRLGGDPAVVLGYVIAHELGHLLLGADSHSHSGIMSYPFEGRRLVLASQGRLGFTPPQAKRLRKRLLERSSSSKPSR